MKLYRVFVVCLCALCSVQSWAQIDHAIRGLFQSSEKTEVAAEEADTCSSASDSLQVAQLQQLLEEAKLNEANLRMEYEQFKLNTLASDSIKRHR